MLCRFENKKKKLKTKSNADNGKNHHLTYFRGVWSIHDKLKSVKNTPKTIKSDRLLGFSQNVTLIETVANSVTLPILLLILIVPLNIISALWEKNTFQTPNLSLDLPTLKIQRWIKFTKHPLQCFNEVCNTFENCMWKTRKPYLVFGTERALWWNNSVLIPQSS